MGSGISECCGGCFGNSGAGLFQAKKDREDYELVVLFLQSVPLFKKQLPFHEIPRLAQHLQGSKKTWQSGQVLVKQGDLGQAFYLIMSGEVDVATEDGGEETIRGTLGRGDHFGGHNLVSQTPNVATIRARDSTTGGYRSRVVVTLSLDRKDFDSLKLKDVLKFPKREAIQRAPTAEDNEEETFTLLDPEELQFIMDSVSRNVNLGEMAKNRQLLEGVARYARKQTFAKDATVAKFGEVGKEFFIIRSGSIDIVMNTAEEAKGQRGAEQLVVKATVAERLARKQQFLLSLHSSATDLKAIGKKCGAHRSAVIGAGDVRASRPIGSARSIQNDTRGDMEDDGLAVSAPKKKGKRPNRASMPPMEDLGRREKKKEGAPDEQVENIKAGQRVTCALPGDDEESVGVVKSTKSGIAKVDFGGKERDVDINLLRLYQDPDVIATLHEKDSFGELSLLYHTRREATFIAREDSIVYVITAKRFRELMERRSGETYKKNCALLDQVDLLESLVCAERYELATHAKKIFIKPGEQILRQGVKSEAGQWYFVESGSGTVDFVNSAKETVHLENIHHASHFGEYWPYCNEKEKISRVNVMAGPSGMTCLIIDGEIAAKTLKATLPESPKLVNVMPPTPQEFQTVAPKLGRGPRCEIGLADLNEACVLGAGFFATVYLMHERGDPTKRYALKKMSKGHLQRNNMIESVRWEKDLMSMINTEFVIKLLRTFNEDNHVCFLMDVGLGGTLYDVLTDHSEVFTDRTSPLNQKGFPAAFYVGCVTLGLEHLHERNVAYRDLKPENVLLGENGYAKICDMGFARFVLGKTNTLAGTPDYMSPELIDFPHAHNQSVDWWALGCLTYELCTGQCPWDDEGIEDQHARLLAIRRSQERNSPRYPFTMPPHMKSFCQKLLQKERSRLGNAGADGVKSDKWFRDAGIDFNRLQDMLIQPPYLPAPFQVPSPGSDNYQEEPEDQFCEYQRDPNNRWSHHFAE